VPITGEGLIPGWGGGAFLNQDFSVYCMYTYFRNSARAAGTVFSILRDPGADSQGERQIKRVKSVQAEAWCERKFTRRAGTAPGRIPLTD